MWWGQKHREKEKRNIHFHEFKWPLFLYYIHINKLSCCSFIPKVKRLRVSETPNKNPITFVDFVYFCETTTTTTFWKKKFIWEKERKFMGKTSEIKCKQMNVWTNGMSTQKLLVNAYTFFYFVWKWKTHEIECTN